jgi:hypothetical protein
LEGKYKKCGTEKGRKCKRKRKIGLEKGRNGKEKENRGS